MGGGWLLMSNSCWKRLKLVYFECGGSSENHQGYEGWYQVGWWRLTFGACLCLQAFWGWRAQQGNNGTCGYFSPWKSCPSSACPVVPSLEFKTNICEQWVWVPVFQEDIGVSNSPISLQDWDRTPDRVLSLNRTLSVLVDFHTSYCEDSSSWPWCLGCGARCWAVIPCSCSSVGTSITEISIPILNCHMDVKLAHFAYLLLRISLWLLIISLVTGVLFS